MKKKNLFFVCWLLLLFVACEGSEEIEKVPVVVNQFDAAQPVSVSGIKPAYGGIDAAFVVEGNFSGSLSGMRVYFDNREAVLTATDGRSIAGIVPKQPEGYNQVSVVIGGDSLAPASLTFKYRQTRSVKTIAGAFGDRQYLDGDINAARFDEASNIGTVKGLYGDNVIVVESWWNDKVRLISLDDNSVITLNTGVSFGTPAVDHAREKFYLVGHWPDQHNIYSFSREDGWTPRMTGIKIEEADLPGSAFSCQLGEDDRFLYVLDGQGNFVRVDLEEKTYEKITLQGDVATKLDTRSQLVYSAYHQCFFAAFPKEAGIFKFYQENGVWRSEKYAGFNGAGSTTGHRLNDAQFITPYGMAVNDEGEIFVVNRDGNFINKIAGDQVELVAGRPGSGGEINGDPLEARFNSPQDIAIDADGNFFIAGGWDGTVRKLTIE
jgi:hypothetical protein